MAQNKGAIVRYRAITDACGRSKAKIIRASTNRLVKQELLITNYQIQEYESCPYSFF